MEIKELENDREIYIQALRDARFALDRADRGLPYTSPIAKIEEALKRVPRED